jgi:hypothetical protein
MCCARKSISIWARVRGPRRVVSVVVVFVFVVIFEVA